MQSNYEPQDKPLACPIHNHSHMTCPLSKTYKPTFIISLKCIDCIREVASQNKDLQPEIMANLTRKPRRDTKMDGCAHIPGVSAEYTTMHGEGQRYGKVEDY